MTETMAKVAARNIAADIDGSTRETLALEDLATMCILDAGNNGVIFKASLILGNEHTNGNGNGHAAKALMTAGPHAHLAKLAFERVYLGSRKRGQLVL
jgi:hypothetical protein